MKHGMQRYQRFFIGTYNKKRNLFPEVCGEGLVSCKLDTKTGQIDKISLFEEVINPTYLAKNPKENILFAVSDNYDKSGEVKAFSIGELGELELLSSADAVGTFTCHVASDQKGERIFVSSYMNGIMTEHLFIDDKMQPARNIISYEGNGPNADRQKQAHAHQTKISPDGDWICVCDLGSDKIWIHNMDQISTDFNKFNYTKVPSGYGPRHLIWNHDLPIIYVFCELNSKILTYSWDSNMGKMVQLAETETLPENYRGQPSGAAIRIHSSNKTLYVSNRGHDSIGVFSISELNGRLEFISCFSTKGKGPRDFNIGPAGRWLLVANQDTNNVIPFQLKPESGLPTGETGPIWKCGTPVCILFEN